MSGFPDKRNTWCNYGQGCMPRRRLPSSKHRAEPDPLAAAVGARLRDLRAEGGFTVAELAAQSALGRGYVNELERGLVVPGLHALAKLAEALGVTVPDLVLGKTARERVFEMTRSMTAVEVRALAKELERREGDHGSRPQAGPKAPAGR
jgi:transcriptional regulator with XRE-family HTH domain